MKGYSRYFLNKFAWLVVTFIFAFVLNFMLPRLMPGDPVAGIAARLAQGMSDSTGMKAVYEQYQALFGTNKPLLEQFGLFVKNVAHGDFGPSFRYYPRPVAEIIGASIWWTIGLQLPAILVGWLIGNALGVLAAYRKQGFDKALLPASIFLSNLPPFGMALILFVIFAVILKWLPGAGGYGKDLIPSFTPGFIGSVIVHYQMPFWTLVLIAIGGQAIGMRSMAIYELNQDYVKYARFLGVKDTKIVLYVFRNAMLPQITGLATALGTLVGGALVVEIVYSYPGLGTTLRDAVLGQDYPLISASALIITTMVLVANFAIEILYGFIDPRIKATQAD